MKLFCQLFLMFTMLSSFSQKQEKVDFIRAEAHIIPEPKEKRVKGVITYEFKVLENCSYIFLDAIEMEFTSVLLNYKKKDFLNTGSKISIKHNFKKGKIYFFTLEYNVKPKQAVYFVGWDDDKSINQIWTQGQGKYTSHWLPSFDDMTEKVEFDLILTFDKKYKVIANGKLNDIIKNKDATKTWVYNMDKPMSSYLLAFVIGDYKVSNVTSESGIPIELYYYPNDSLKVEATYRYSQRIFNFLEDEIGVDYPWLNYKQIPVKDFLYAGMENTGTTIFLDNYVIDSIGFIDRNYVNINAHELAHQWFGNLVTEKNGNSHWLHEGFATYYSYLAEKEIFGDAYYYWKLLDSAEELNRQQLNNKGESLLNPKASSLTFYEKGAWALHALREEIGGTAFKKGVEDYLSKNQFKNAEIVDFISAMEKACGKSLDAFHDKWLKSKTFPYKEVEGHLAKKSKDIQMLQYIKEEVLIASSSFLAKEKIIKGYWDKAESEDLKSRIIATFSEFLSEEFILSALHTNNLKIRRAVAKSTIKISGNMKKTFEGLLLDNCYSTQENALYALWSSFPKERSAYLNQTQSLIGLPNKNIRLLWLTLAMVTPEYKSLKTADYYKELVSYTGATYSTEIRTSSFQFLRQTIGLDNESLKNLMAAASHHSWQFKKYSRNLLSELIQDNEIKNRVSVLAKEFNNKENVYFKSLLE
ncbi:M1 family metallopeptidase [uncultured Maribacter sp.]|uniref:M1 family metallopeptidase n=1 Tax=uncultured Maribacter sp. TaxID=431308 RepID=UPI0026111D8D|nr:M1 family metallopeptidase [uncultured Maribacter sp.]